MPSHSPSQKYLSTRGGTYDASFESVVLQGLASDGGLYIPEEIPSIPTSWTENDAWRSWSFQELAYQIFSLYISPSEIPPEDLREIVDRSYSTFRNPDITPLIALDEEKRLYLLELFHGPTFAFKDVALQFLGNLFEYFLVRRNAGHASAAANGATKREHLTVVGATSGDTGSAAIYGLRGKRDVSVFIMYPQGRVSPIQEAQMTSVLDENVHCLAVDGTFDDCQDFVKALFGDEEINKTHRLAAVNSINWARILAQISYYFYSWGQLQRRIEGDSKARFVVPTGNFGDVLAGYFAMRMGLPVEKFVVATNENDILDRFWRSGHYEKKPVKSQMAQGGFVDDGVKACEEGVKETYSPAMDILVSSNFERLLWLLAYENASKESLEESRQEAGKRVKTWYQTLKSTGGFTVEKDILEVGRRTFESERVSDDETLTTIRETYSKETAAASNKAPNGTSNGTTGTIKNGGYILDPHTAIGVAASYRSIDGAPPDTLHIALATAHPAKFSNAVSLALKDEKNFQFQDLLPQQFIGLEDLPRKVRMVKKNEGLEGLRALIREGVPSQ